VDGGRDVPVAMRVSGWSELVAGAASGITFEVVSAGSGEGAAER
jgi:hypothetical protein